MAEQATSAERRSHDEVAALREQLAEQTEEVLRLRDLLIAKDAELGAAKGRLAELSEHSARLIAAARMLQARARVPGLARKALARLRRS